MRFDGDRARVDAERLAFPRRSGSAGAVTARDYVVAGLRGAGLDPVTEEFVFSPFLVEGALPLVLFSSAGVVLAATYAYPSSPGVSLALLLFGFLAGLPATRWCRATERLLDLGERRESANIVAELAGPPDAARHLILMAHTDSKSQRLPIWTRLVAAIGVLVGGLGLLLSALAAVVAARLVIPPVLVAAAGCASALGMVFLGANRSGNRSPGALDNATGAAALLELARDLAGTGLRHTRVTFVATGAEEDGLAGAVRFFQRHAEELGPNPLLINLDSVGAGGVVAILNRHGIPPSGTGDALAGQIQEVAGKEGIRVKEVLLPAGAATDHFPAACRKIPAVTFATLGRGLRRVHTPLDTPSRVDWDGLDRAGRLALAVILHLDTE